MRTSRGRWSFTRLGIVGIGGAVVLVLLVIVALAMAIFSIARESSTDGSTGQDAQVVLRAPIAERDNASSLSITAIEEHVSERDVWRPVGTLSNSIEALGSFARALVDALIWIATFAVPLAIVAAVIAIPVILVRRRRANRWSRHQPPCRSGEGTKSCARETAPSIFGLLRTGSLRSASSSHRGFFVDSGCTGASSS